MSHLMSVRHGSCSSLTLIVAAPAGTRKCIFWSPAGGSMFIGVCDGAMTNHI